MRGRRRQPDDLLVHRSHPRPPARLPHPPPRTPPSSSWSATTAPPPRSSTSPTACSPRPAAGPPTTGWSWSPSATAGPEPVYTEYADEPAEAEGAARRIRDLIDAGVPAGEIAVLFRTNAQSEAYEQALADAGVPYQLRGAERFFDRPEVRKAGIALRGAARFGGNDSLLDDAVDLPSQVRAVLSGEGWTHASPRPAPAPSGTAGSRWPPWSRSPRTSPPRKPGATLADLVAELDERAAAQHAPTVQGVTLASLHAAKGLEWDAVFLVGLAEGMMPITYAKTDEQIEEERRLLYVGVTRARAHLSLSWALVPLARRPAEPPAQPLPRRAAARLDRAAGGSAAAGGTRRRRARRRGRRRRPPPRARPRTPARCRVCGRTLTDAGEMKLMRCEDCPSDMDEGLYERLREWRAVQARRAGPARVLRLHRQDTDGDRRGGAGRRAGAVPASRASERASSTATEPTCWPSAQVRRLSEDWTRATDTNSSRK